VQIEEYLLVRKKGEQVGLPGGRAHSGETIVQKRVLSVLIPARYEMVGITA